MPWKRLKSSKIVLRTADVKGICAYIMENTGADPSSLMYSLLGPKLLGYGVLGALSLFSGNIPLRCLGREGQTSAEHGVFTMWLWVKTQGYSVVF